MTKYDVLITTYHTIIIEAPRGLAAQMIAGELWEKDQTLFFTATAYGIDTCALHDETSYAPGFIDKWLYKPPPTIKKPRRSHVKKTPRLGPDAKETA